MSLDPYVGWGITTFLSQLVNKSSNSNSDSSLPSTLNVTATKLGDVIPAVIGTGLVKSPITSYYGDFRSEIYTETYAAHANFNAWPMVFTLIAQYIASPATTTGGGTGTAHTSHGPAPVTVKIFGKDMAVGPLINSLFMWLLSWLINGRNLKTTIQKGFKYYLGYQQVVCWSSPNTKLKKIYMNEKLAWEGSISAREQNGSPFIIKIDNDQLFGGPDEEGGFVGEIHVYLGGANQKPDPWMSDQMKVDTVQEELRGLTPAYRPFISVVVPTAYVGKQATVPTMWYEIENIPDALGLGGIDEDANPAEVFYETHVNKNWGLAESEELLDLDSLKKIGETLKTEKIGITTNLNSKLTAGSLLSSICEHINAVKYIEPKTGKLKYKLIRNDTDFTDPNGIFLLNESNISNISFSRLDWRETISEIAATYTDRASLYETGSLSDTDPANVEINNGILTTKTYSYPYFTKAENALWAAKRELMQQGYPLATVSIEGNRMLYKLRIGDVCRLDFPAYGIKNMLLRITNTNLGKFTEGIVKIEAMEDIFSLAKTDFNYSDSSDWKPEPLYPTGVQLFQYLELPYEIRQIKDTYVFALAVKPDLKMQSWTVWRKRMGAAFETTNTMSKWTAAGRLVYDYDEFSNAEDLIGIEIVDLGGIEDLRFNTSADSATDIISARRGGKLVLIGTEIMAWSNLTQMPNGHWRLEGLIRGVYDTVPVNHGNGEILYFIESGHCANVTTGGPVCSEGNVVSESYNITANTVDKKEDFDVSKVKNLTTVRRAERPSPPGRIRISGQLLSDQVHADDIAGNIIIKWVTRNKQLSFGCVSQDDEKEYWTNTDFSIPDGLEYKVNIHADGTLIKEYMLPGTQLEFSYSWAQRAMDGGTLAQIQGETTIEIYAKRKDLLSYQAQKRTFHWIVPTMVQGTADMLMAMQFITAWADSKEIVVPPNASSDVQKISYSSLPVILIGMPAKQAGANTVLCYDGKYLIPDGQALLIKNKTEYDVVTLDTGVVLKTKFKEVGETVEKYIQWNGTEFVDFK